MAETAPIAEANAPASWTAADIFWLIVLVVSILVGFGMTIFAPT